MSAIDQQVALVQHGRQRGRDRDACHDGARKITAPQNLGPCAGIVRGDAEIGVPEVFDADRHLERVDNGVADRAAESYSGDHGDQWQPVHIARRIAGKGAIRHLDETLRRQVHGRQDQSNRLPGEEAGRSGPVRIAAATYVEAGGRALAQVRPRLEPAQGALRGLAVVGMQEQMAACRRGIRGMLGDQAPLLGGECCWRVGIGHQHPHGVAGLQSVQPGQLPVIVLGGIGRNVRAAGPQVGRRSPPVHQAGG